MENQYLDDSTLKELIRKISTSNSAESKDDLDILNDAISSFHAYVDTVIRGETKLLIHGNSLQGQEYRDAVTQYDQDRHGCHETVIINARILNRLALKHGLQPVYKGDDTQRHQVADFCLELDSYLFRNRRMKLS